MKKLLYLLLILPLFISCSSSDDDTPAQDYTSFTVTIDSSSKFKDCIAGYKLADGTYKKIGDLGELTKGIYSPEIRINDESISEIFIFAGSTTVIRFNNTYKLIKNIKNTVVVINGTSGIDITDKLDPTQYPQ